MTYKTGDRHRISDYLINTDPEKTVEYWVREGADNILYTSEGGRIPFRQCKSGKFKGKFFCRKSDIFSDREKGTIFMLKAYFYAFLDDDLYNISDDEEFGLRLEWNYISPQEKTLQLLKSYNINKHKHFKRYGGWIATEKGHMIYEPVEYCLYNDELYSDNWMEHFQRKAWFSNNVKRDFTEAYAYAKRLCPKWYDV